MGNPNGSSGLSSTVGDGAPGETAGNGGVGEMEAVVAGDGAGTSVAGRWTLALPQAIVTRHATKAIASAWNHRRRQWSARKVQHAVPNGSRTGAASIDCPGAGPYTAGDGEEHHDLINAAKDAAVPLASPGVTGREGPQGTRAGGCRPGRSGAR